MKKLEKEEFKQLLQMIAEEVNVREINLMRVVSDQGVFQVVYRRDTDKFILDDYPIPSQNQ